MRTSEASRVLAATGTLWDTSGPLPFPRGDWLCCPVCRSGLRKELAPVIRFWRFHTRPAGATLARRCDLSFKCRYCAAVWPHGIALDEDTWSRRWQPESPTLRWFNRHYAVEATIWARDVRDQLGAEVQPWLR